MKIPADIRNRQYELTCLVGPDYTQDELTQVKESLVKVISSHGGEVKDTQDWGKRELAYSIKKAGKKYSQAHYLHFQFEADASQATNIKETINITEQVIRFLLVNQE
ncbi:MAG TPA: 30S ribosomal protein S6 [Candidatus Woesebacteria bacterium]|nr:30S ribosomal protein S6 [Candidatus Woesebacteria bacterium]